MDKTLTEEQAVILTAYTGILCGPYPPFQQYAEKLLGRRVLTHEFGERRVWRELKVKSRADFDRLTGLSSEDR